MIRPFIVLHSVAERSIIVVSTTDVHYKVMLGMVVIEVTRNIVNVVAISFLYNVGGGKGHCDDSLSNIGEVQLLPLIPCRPLGSSDNLTHKAEHLRSIIKVIGTTL